MHLLRNEGDMPENASSRMTRSGLWTTARMKRTRRCWATLRDENGSESAYSMSTSGSRTARDLDPDRGSLGNTLNFSGPFGAIEVLSVSEPGEALGSKSGLKNFNAAFT